MKPKITTKIPNNTPTERLQKALATVGIGSRRQIEVWISMGRVTVNGTVAKIGDRVSLDDQIFVDGKRIYRQATKVANNARRVLVYYKPEGEVCTRRDPENRPTIFEKLPKIAGARWLSIGRLDLNTSGLLLLTTDGELANRLMHPSYEIEREYAVRILGQVDADMCKRLLKGVDLEDGPAKFDAIFDAGGSGANHWYHVVLREGRNREVRRLWETQGVKVSRLMRIRFANVSLSQGLRRGAYTELNPEDVAALAAIVGL